MSYEPPLPSSSRIIDHGHSWVAPPLNPYGSSNVASAISGWPADQEQWPNALRDALGVGTSGSYTKTFILPALGAAVDATYLIDAAPGDCTIDVVWYVPAATITPAASNFRIFTLLHSVHANIGLGYLGAVNSSTGNGTALTGAQPTQIYNINTPNGPLLPSGNTLTQVVDSPYTPGLQGTGFPSILFWQSIHASSGVADPGGFLIIRYGTRYRNYAVSGATLLSGMGASPYQYGSWWTDFSYGAFSRPNAAEVNLTAATTSSTALTCSPLQYAIPSGSTIAFSNGVTITTSGAAALGATSLTATGSVTIPKGAQGHLQSSGFGFNGKYETLSPSGLHVHSTGINDADSAIAQDVNAWTETVRSDIARDCCSAMDYSNEGNFVTSGSTWGTISAVANGTFPYALGNWYCGSSSGVSVIAPIAIYTGAGTGSPTIIGTIGPAFEGGVVDVFLLALAGSSVGVAGTITVDGGTPPQGSVTFNTSGQSTSGLLTQAPGGTVSAAGGNNTVTGSSTTFTAQHVGSILTVSGGSLTIPAGSMITAVASATSITVLPPSGAVIASGSGSTPTVHQYVPMVKRLTGLAAGAHTITITINSVDSSTQSAVVVYALGIESQNPQTPVLWCNIARSAIQTSQEKTNAAAYNAASLAVINGTATPLTGNTAEPALGTNVQYVDIDTLFGGASPNTAYFLPDGLHPNSRGHRLLARTLFTTIRNNFSPDQLIAR